VEEQDYIWEIYLLNLVNNATTVLNESGSYADHAWVDTGKVVWMQNHRIRLKNLISGIESEVTFSTTNGSQDFPKLSKRWLVYLDFTRFPRLPGFTRGWDVMLFDLCTLDMYHDDPMCQ
jgi:hypothetical protein